MRLESNNKAEHMNKCRLHVMFKVNTEEHERYLEEQTRQLLHQVTLLSRGPVLWVRSNLPCRGLGKH